MTSPRRRWFSFSLRTLFVVVTIFCVWLGWQVRIVHERRAVLDEIAGAGYVTLEDSHWKRPSYQELIRVSSVRRLFGDSSYFSITVPPNTSPQLLERLEYAFPESNLYLWESGVSSNPDVGTRRDSLYAPASERRPNVGTIFKTGLIEK